MRHIDGATTRSTPRYRPVRPAARALAVQAKAMYDNDPDLTLTDVAEAFGVTRERVRQWVVGLGGTTRGNSELAQRRRAARQAAELVELRDSIVAAYRDGNSIAKVAAATGARLSTVRQVVADEFTVEQREGRRGNQAGIVQFTDDDIAAALQACAADTGERSVTMNQYRAWHARQRAAGHRRPSPSTILNRFDGSWAAALDRAGLVAVRGNYARRRDYVGEEAAWEAVMVAARALGHAPSIAEYDAFAQQHKLVCCATVRKRCGRWSQLRLRAAAQLERERS